MEILLFQRSHRCHKSQQVLLLVGLAGYFSALSSCSPTVAGSLPMLVLKATYARYISYAFPPLELLLLKSSSPPKETLRKDVYRTPNHQYPSNQRPAIC